MMIVNLYIGPVRTKMTIRPKINNYEVSMQNNRNYRVYSTEVSKSKIINADEREYNFCSAYNIE